MARLISLSALLLLVVARVLSLPSTLNEVLDIFQVEHQTEIKTLLPATFNSTGLSCPNVRTRKEWRSLTDAEKASFISAVKCLQSTPVSTPELPEVKSVFDQFQAVHIVEAESVHGDAQFLPWHRYFVMLFEKSLRKECSYQGVMPYWNWSLDVDNGKKFSDSPLFSPDPVIGFGGDGVPGTYTPPNDPTGENRIVSPEFYRGCVEDGAFAGLKLQVGPGRNVGSHCLTRGIDNAVASETMTKERVAGVMDKTDFASFWPAVEGQPLTDSPKLHDGGHISMGGEMSNYYSSPGDPLFYLHHCFLDFVWWKWQNADAKNRLYQISGRTTPEDDFRNVTMDYPLSVGQLSPGQVVRIGDVMNIMQQPNCYQYEEYEP